MNPEAVFRAELQSYPLPVSDLPVELDLDDVPAVHRGQALELLLRRDKLYLSQGKDIAEWASGYEASKANWLSTADWIINQACEAGTLQRQSHGRFRDLASAKEAFLASLDLRHLGSLDPAEREALGANIIHLVLGETSKLPAIRLSSLCFWYAYVDTDPSNLTKRSASDIGDFFHMSLIPYCHFFTVDKTMFQLLQRVRLDVSYPCRVLIAKDLNRELGILN